MSWFEDMARQSQIHAAGGDDAARAQAEQQIRAAYQQLLGRSPTDAEIQGQLAGGTSPEQVQNAIDSIAASSERNAFLSAHQNDDGSYQPAANTLGANTATPPPTTTTTPTTNAGGSASEFGQAWLNFGGADLNAFVAQWNQSHPNAQAQFSGKKNHDVTIGGQTYHAVNADGQKFWFSGGGGGTGTTLGSLLDPYTQQFQAPGHVNLGGPAGIEYIPPVPTLNLPAFQLPTGEQALAQDPGYGLRVQQGEQAITNRLSSQGLLRGGPTLKSFIDYNQNMASNEYGNAVNRAYQAYGANINTTLANYQPLFEQWKTQGTAGANQSGLDWNQAKNLFDTNFDVFKWNKSFPYNVLSDQQRIGLSAAQAV